MRGVAGILLLLLLGTALHAAAPLQGVDVAAGGGTASIPLGSGVTHVVFLASWCPPCLEELPTLRELEARYGAEGYQLVIIAVGRRQTLARVQKLQRDRELPGKVIFDIDGALERRFSVTDLPHHLLLGSDGGVLWTGDSPGASMQQRLADEFDGGR